MIEQLEVELWKMRAEYWKRKYEELKNETYPN